MLEERGKATTPTDSWVHAPPKLHTCLLVLVPRFRAVSTTDCCSFLHMCCEKHFVKRKYSCGSDETKTNTGIFVLGNQHRVLQRA